MEKEIVEKKLGEVAALKVEFKDGKLVAEVDILAEPIVELVFAEAAKLIPGDTAAEKAILDGAKAMLLAKLKE